MPLVESVRRVLTKAVDESRAALEMDTKDQLERFYGFDRDGVVRPLDALGLDPRQRAVAESLREWHRHLSNQFCGAEVERSRNARERMATETAFTVLHRLVALRMMEEREVLKVAVLKQGELSDGFKLYSGAAEGALGDSTATYRAFLERVFDEVAGDLRILFDRREPASLVFPTDGCLRKVVGELTQDALAHAWADDETIGWVYQDFHSAAERREMRRGKEVPETAYELAVRNQLFTPRWVVEFLTDNTLGRVWLEMNDGVSSSMETLPGIQRTQSHGPIARKDPRDIRVLDPACGSGHFLLYAYDILERIYEEAWQRHLEVPGRRSLRDEFEDHLAFRAAIPALILRHNLFGVDIDRRPLQVAGLALWLRAQRAWRDARVSYAERPAIRRTNLVCAEPMPGDAELLSAFTQGLEPPLLGELVRTVWHSMEPVSETGLLLRIDEQIKNAVAKARGDWTETPPSVTMDSLFPNWDRPRQAIRELAPEPSFWDQAEQRLLDALEAYAASASDDERVRKRLFAEDAERGFAFIDLSRLRFDVVLMNPPFGHPAAGTKESLDTEYANCGHEIYAMFFRRALELCEPHGRIGAITNRTWLALKGLKGLRTEVFGKLGAVTLGADLGSFVLEAQVETAAVVVDRRGNDTTEATWIRLLKTARKPSTLANALEALAAGAEHPYVYRAQASRFAKLPESVYAYWMSPELVASYVGSKSFGKAAAEVKQGTSTAKDFRFLRASWEVDPREITLTGKWPRFAKGGEYRPFWDDVHLSLNFRNRGQELASFPKSYIRSPRYYGRLGVTWPLRTTSPFGPRVCPRGLTFGHKGPVAIPLGDPGLLLGVLASSPLRLLLSVSLAAGDEQAGSAAKSYEVGVIKRLPWPGLSEERGGIIRAATLRAIAAARAEQILRDITAETCVAFGVVPGIEARGGGVRAIAQARVEAREDLFVALAEADATIRREVSEAYGFSKQDLRVLDEEMEPTLLSLSRSADAVDVELFTAAYLTKDSVPGDTLPGGRDAETDSRVERRRRKQHASLRSEEDLCRLFEVAPAVMRAVRRDLGVLRAEDVADAAADIVSWAVGVAFGRWDLRLAQHPEWLPGWSDPWGALPLCLLGQLVDGLGLPATPDRIASPEWWRARREATALPKVVDVDGVRRFVDEDGRAGTVAEVSFTDYPFHVAWSGLLVDDALDDLSPSRHTLDLWRRVQGVFESLWPRDHEEREAELAAALQVGSIRDWFRRPDRFFENHRKRYSKSGRVAPIYWPLATEDGRYTVWLYYPRIGASMLAEVVNVVGASLSDLAREAERIDMKRRQFSGSDELQARADAVADAVRQRTELQRVVRALIDGGWTPQLDDGAIVNAGPLRTLFREREWADRVHLVWNEVQQGEHDWSYVAMWLRRNTVLERCRTDQDIAVAHDRLDLYQPPPAKTRAQKRKSEPLPLLDDGDGDE